MKYWDGLDWVMASIVTAFTILLVYSIIFGVKAVIVEKDCLEAGYPKYAVSYDLEGYCMNLDGNVTVKVNKL